MGTFYVNMRVGKYVEGVPAPVGDLMPVTAMVDTGATHTALPLEMMEHLGISPFPTPMDIVLADGSRQTWPLALARIVYEDSHGRYDRPCHVVFAPPPPEDGPLNQQEEFEPLLGATTLEVFGLMVDPVAQELVPRTIRARPF